MIELIHHASKFKDATKQKLNDLIQQKLTEAKDFKSDVETLLKKMNANNDIYSIKDVLGTYQIITDKDIIFHISKQTGRVSTNGQGNRPGVGKGDIKDVIKGIK